MQFRILGPLEVLENERALNVGGSKQRGILAVLLLNANQVVSSAGLIDALWEDQPPATAQKALQVYVSQLRGKVGKDRLLTKAPGYLLQVAPDELDLSDFEALLEQCRALEPKAAAAKLREALALWRGPTLAEFASQRFAEAGIARLEELRLACTEERIDADLACGRHAELIGELEGLVKEHPLRERLREQLMLALYRSGRQAEALRAYKDARRVLVDELGIEPGKRLRELEQAILRQDVSLEPTRAAEVLATPAGRRAAASATPPAPTPVARKVAVGRKTVTVLFADVADSTALGERVDPETLRGALARWFDEARAVIERHGGTVEKYIGDSVMAVFGVPRLHEDDAVRAVRAAAELGDALAQLNEQLERERGLRFTVRVGINTGEVVTGDGSGTLVTGDAVNVAKRLEEAGDGGDVIVGDATHGLARTAARFERISPLAVKGKSERVRAWRLVGVDRDGHPYERRFDTPLVGRRRELEQLRCAFRRSVEERTCHLFTLLGAAGIGKTRLASELFGELAGEASVLTGRCLPYGDGITFWPLHEVIRELGGEDEIMRLLASNDDGQLVCERLTGEPGSQELFWAVRRLCETLADARPLVLCFEDVHWAEPKFLDLIEYLAGWIRGTPILLLCLARPEFLDERPAWLSGQENASSLTLSPLSAAESRQLVGALGVPGDPGDRIARAAEGNPLYAEQMAAMVAEGGSLETIPPTIHALLAARLDRLSDAERSVIGRAAVAGKEFWRDAIGALDDDPARADTGSVLMSLVRKELIRPERSTERADDAFRFAHVLIRDAAYAAIPKETRASLHERFAAWLENESTAPDLDELVGYHLEQAYRNRDALGPLDADAHALAERAAVILGRAGRRAVRRGDMPAAARLLERAALLLPAEDARSRELRLELGITLGRLGRFAEGDRTLDEVARRADEASDQRLRCHASLEQALLRTYTYPESGTEELLRVANAVIPVFQELHDDAGLARAWVLVAEAHWFRCRIGPMEEALKHARRHVQPETRHAEVAIWNALARAALAGPLPVPEAIRRCEEIEAAAPPDRSLHAVLATVRGYLEAMRERFDTARDLYRTSHATLEELGQIAARAALQTWSGAIELLAGDARAAEAELRSAFGTLEPIGDKQNLATIAASLAAALHAQKRDDEAIRFTQLSEQLASYDDATSQIEWRAVRAKVLAREDQSAEAEQLARESVSLAKETDCPNLLGNALLSLGETLARVGRDTEAAAALASARSAYEEKQNMAMATVVRERLAALAAPPRTGVTSRDGR